MQEIYFDNFATTCCNEQVVDLAVKIMREEYGNPSSLHSKGFNAQLYLQTARQQLAKALVCDDSEITFTSGGTESNNIAVLGTAKAKTRQGKTIVAMATCHSSILAPLAHLKNQGYNIKLIPPLTDSNADVGSIINAIDEDTILLCTELVGSETGAITPINEICKLARRKNSKLFIHCDAVQAFGKEKFNLLDMDVNTLSISAHKIAAPKGCGVLYLKKGSRILPITYGGSQEKSLRPGTENVPIACAFGLAAELKMKNFTENYNYVSQLQEHFINKVKKISSLCINSPCNCTPYISNISAEGYRSQTMLNYLAQNNIYVSSGTACSKGAESYVLKAMGLSHNRIDSALRISFSPQNTIDEIDVFFEILCKGISILTRSVT